jgi:hypothetical protein
MGAKNIIHLVKRDKQRVKHVALSHHWSEANPIRTTLESCAFFYAGVQFEQLPKTFKDAVLVCLELGVNFLWIDSLCIVQDDRLVSVLYIIALRKSPNCMQKGMGIGS